MGAWLAEMREAKFHELAELVSRFPQAAARPDGAMRIFLGVAGNWVDIRMNCAAGVVLISDAGVARRRRA